MRHFPKPVPVPSSVMSAREERYSHMKRSMLLGIIIRSLIILAELTGVYFFGSASLLLDAVSSLVDIFCTSFLFLIVTLAKRPPDINHPFGHGRFEPLAGLQLGLLLAVVGLGMLVYQSFMLTEMHQGHLDERAWIIPFVAVILLEICYAVAMRTAKEHHSPALAADAAHYLVDSLTSAFAAIALAFAAFLPEWSFTIDHVGAIAIALLMIGLGISAMRNNINQVLDRRPPAHYFQTVQKAAKRVSGVLDTEKIRVQLYGPDAHVDIDIEVDPKLSVEQAHKISQKVRAEIQKEWPAVRDVTVHIEPYYPGDH